MQRGSADNLDASVPGNGLVRLTNAAVMIGFLVCFPFALLGGAIAWYQAGRARGWQAGHYQVARRTVAVGICALLAFAAALAIVLLLAGEDFIADFVLTTLPLLLVLVIWGVVRSIRCLNLAFGSEPVARPASWGFLP
ncbi:hypothetical protein AB6802_15780 [Mesorhizobium sp. RCC_202]|uniref:hypothetical protein n=1 Tax=Mesorhizobium sp. RCC_202 TaxID=3239222 RepID=UPI00352669E2